MDPFPLLGYSLCCTDHWQRFVTEVNAHWVVLQLLRVLPVPFRRCHFSQSFWWLDATWAERMSTGRHMRFGLLPAQFVLGLRLPGDRRAVSARAEITVVPPRSDWRR